MLTAGFAPTTSRALICPSMMACGSNAAGNSPIIRPAPADEKRFRANRRAWAYFTAQAPSYQRVAIYWVTSAKREETRERRLATLIDDSANSRRLGIATLTPKKS